MLKMKFCAPLLVCVMFANLIWLCQGQAGPPGFLNYPRIDFSSQFQPNFPYPYAAGNLFQQGVGIQDPRQLFLALLDPIEPNLFPSNIIMIKYKLRKLIMTNQLEVGPVMDYLMKFQQLHQFDLMIAGLTALRDSLPVDCPLHQELGQLIVYSIFTRSQAKLFKNFNNNENNGNGPTPTLVIPTPFPEPTQQLSCDSIKNMLTHWQALFDQRNCQRSISNNDVGHVYNNQYNEFGKRHSQQAHKIRSVYLSKTNQLEKNTLHTQTKSETFPFGQLIEILPQPQNEVESLKYNTVKMFLQSNEIRNYFKNLTDTDYSNKQKLLHIVLNKVAQSNLVDNVKEAFNFYLLYANHTEAGTFDYSSLIDLIPQPIDPEENEKYEIVKSFLSRKDIYKFLKYIDASIYSDRKLLFKTVLKTIINSKLDIKTTEAFAYYLNYQESLTELKLYTKKEIRKHFELTKIFIDTLDIDSLPNDAKLAFKKFFKFISIITKEQMKNFDTWSEVKTKGEFMKELFKYLLAQSFTPQEVKECIAKLEPLVNMTGKGALPP